MSGMEVLAGAAIFAGLAGAAVTASGQIYQGQQEKEAAYVMAAGDEARGREEFAASQREAEERRLEGELIMSRQQAAAAASGGGAGSDAPTIVRLMTETGKRAQFGADTVRYGGESRRDAYFRNAGARRKSGDASFIGGILSGVGTLARGAGSAARIGATI